MRLLTYILIIVGFAVTAVAEINTPLILEGEMLSKVRLSAESPYLAVPDGSMEGAVISKEKLRKALEKQFKLEEVSDLSIDDELYFVEVVGNFFTLGFVNLAGFDHLTLSFVIKFPNASTGTNLYIPVQCGTVVGSDHLFLLHCNSENVRLAAQEEERIKIPMSSIIVSIEEYTGS